MKTFFAYVRVSTMRQGEAGVSLREQRAIITRHAERSGLFIKQWFEERQTAAKSGRPVFGEMVKKLKLKQASGVLIHKIDRSARNLPALFPFSPHADLPKLPPHDDWREG
jgi:site-specific DNA recombinase